MDFGNVVSQVLGNNLLSNDLVFGLDIFTIDIPFHCAAQFEVGLGRLLVDESDVTIHRLLVQLLDLDLPLLVDRLEDVLLVVLLGLSLYLLEDFRVLGEDTVVQESLGQAEALAFFVICDVDELTLALVYDVVVTDKLGTSQLLANEVLLIGDAVCYQTETDTDSSLVEEVHLRDLILLIIHNFVVIGRLKLSGHETK